MNLTPMDKATLINAIANREGTARELAHRYGTTVDELRAFTSKHRQEIEEAKQESEEWSDEVTPLQLDQMWISNKHARLQRYQDIANELYAQAMQGSTDSTVLRELRSYMLAAANELGQLLHRGSGDGNTGDTLSVDFNGVDIETLK